MTPEEILYRHGRVRVLTGEDFPTMGSDHTGPVQYFRVEQHDDDGWHTMSMLEAPVADRPLVAQAATEALRQAEAYA